MCLPECFAKEPGREKEQMTGGKWTPFKISNIVMKNLWKILFLESKGIMLLKDVLT